MSTDLYGATPPRNHHEDSQRTLSRVYRDVQLSGGNLSLSAAAEMARKVESPAWAYRDRGSFGLRRW